MLIAKRLRASAYPAGALRVAPSGGTAVHRQDDVKNVRVEINVQLQQSERSPSPVSVGVNTSCPA